MTDMRADEWVACAQAAVKAEKKRKAAEVRAAKQAAAAALEPAVLNPVIPVPPTQLGASAAAGETTSRLACKSQHIIRGKV